MTLSGHADLETSPTHRRPFVPRNVAAPRQKRGWEGFQGLSTVRCASFSDTEMFSLPTLSFGRVRYPARPASGLRVQALVEQQLAIALREVVDVTRRRKAESG